jgi:hypothetical protein
MKRISAPCAAVILAGMFLSACNLALQSQGPRTWIDQPLDGAQLPLAPLTIQAHASGADGVEAIEFYVADGLVASVPAGGARLSEALIQWTPPAAGVYVISASAVDDRGNVGPKASVRVTVGDAAETPIPPSPTPQDALCAGDALSAPALLSPEDGAALTGPPLLGWSYPDTSCHPASFAVDISQDASFADTSLGFGTLDHNETSRAWPLAAGQCYFWRVKAYVTDTFGPPSAAWTFCIEETASTVELPALTLTQNAHCRSGPGAAYESVTVLIKGQTAIIEGRNAENTWFWVTQPSGGGHCWISVIAGDLSGEWNTAPVIAAPPLPATVAATPTVDLDPPLISGLSATPALISAKTVCGATPATTIITARVSDAGGVARVTVRISGGGDFDMAPSGGEFYQVMLGPFDDAGALTMFVQARDSAGNTATSAPIEVQVVTCPG